MNRWQFNVLFGVMVAGTLFLPFAKAFGIDIDPVAIGSFGSITVYVLTQRPKSASKPDPDPEADAEGKPAESKT